MNNFQKKINEEKKKNYKKQSLGEMSGSNKISISCEEAAKELLLRTRWLTRKFFFHEGQGSSPGDKIP